MARRGKPRAIAPNVACAKNQKRDGGSHGNSLFHEKALSVLKGVTQSGDTAKKKAKMSRRKALRLERAPQRALEAGQRSASAFAASFLLATTLSCTLYLT